MQQSMSHLFSQIPRADIQRSVFDRHHTLKTAFNSGYLVPIFTDEALPGDTFDLNLSLFGRLSTLAVPVMDNLYLETFFFAVPYRLVWSNWQHFMGERDTPQQIENPPNWLVPVLSDFTASAGDLSDYLGLPIGVTLHNVSSLWHRAYTLVFNEWFRDENLQSLHAVPTGDGPDNISSYFLVRRRKAKDYFTSCLPWPQKGPGVEIPIGGTAPIYGTGNPLQFFGDTNSQFLMNSNPVSGKIGFNVHRDIGDSPVNLLARDNGTTSVSGYEAKIPTKSELEANFKSRTVGSSTVNPDVGIYADLSTATATTINQLREAFQIQRLMEADARGGTRYTEILRAHFSVVSPDARLQRPEYLGGTATRINVHPVSQQSATDSVTPQGNLAAFATVGEVQHVFTKSFTEHCLILGIANVRADLTYQQGIPRMFSRRTRYDFYWPTLAHLGEQAVLNKEIYCQGDHAGADHDDEVFGYQERWAEYRYKPSQITGAMRSTASAPLDVWHLAQKFTSLPVLGSGFIQDNPPVNRVVAVSSEPQILLDADFGLKCVRPMPVYSVPGLIDHF